MKLRGCLNFLKSRRDEAKKPSLLYINEHFERLSNAEFRKFRQPLSKTEILSIDRMRQCIEEIAKFMWSK
jgi:hypothetical protein